MAIDTRRRRASAIHHARPWLITLPPADGEVDRADRRHLAFGYSGLAGVGGPYTIRGLHAYVPGAAAAHAYVPGAAAAHAYVPGAAAAHVAS